MRYLKSNKKRLKEKRGEGTGAEYKPFIKATEFPDYGSAVQFKDWITGREVHMMSHGESIYYHLLRFRDDVTDVREQVPLDPEITRELADMYGITHPGKKDHIMTTDLLVTYEDGHLEAYSVKSAKEGLRDREKEILFLEMQYWEAHSIPWHLVYKSDADIQKAENIRICRMYADIENVVDEVSLIKYLIIHKVITTDMSCPLDFKNLVEEYRDQIEEYKRGCKDDQAG